MGKRKKANGLLTEKTRDIEVVSADKREFWHNLRGEAAIQTAHRFRGKWTDEEVQIVIEANPDGDSYQELAERLGRTPGAIRMKRSIMIALLRHEDDARERARLATEDPKTHHSYFDYGHVDRILRNLGYYDKDLTERWQLARHLLQPSRSWRGDGTQSVLATRRKQTEAVKQLAKSLADGKRDKK